jgi:hypothetical protein
MDPKDEAEKDAAKPDAKRTPTSRRKLIGSGIGVVVVLALAIALIAGGSDDDSSSSPSSEPPTIVSLDELRDAVASEDNPIYWAGPQDGTELELSHSEGGRTYVRYLTDGAKAGDPGNEFLTVGTYPFPDAAAALRKLSKEPGGILASSPGGGVVYFSRQRPENVYLAFPGSSLQVEVFDPDAKRALGLVASGLIVPIG